MRKLFLLSLFILAFLTASARVPQTCADFLQTGQHAFTLDHGNAEIVMLSFPKAFCESPVVVATGGSQVTLIQLGVVTPASVSFLVSGVPGVPLTLAWHAAPASQTGK